MTASLYGYSPPSRKNADQYCDSCAMSFFAETTNSSIDIFIFIKIDMVVSGVTLTTFNTWSLVWVETSMVRVASATTMTINEVTL